MKNLLKKINVFGLALILVCGAVFTTQSAFTNSKFVPQLYYYNPAVNPSVWQNAGTLAIDNVPDEDGNYEENSFRCDFDDEQVCSGEFNSTSATLPIASTPLSGTETIGIFQLNP